MARISKEELLRQLQDAQRERDMLRQRVDSALALIRLQQGLIKHLRPLPEPPEEEADAEEKSEEA